MTRSPNLSSAPPMTITGPTGPPSVAGASRSGVDASVIHVSVPAFELPRHAAFFAESYMLTVTSSRRPEWPSGMELVLHSTERSSQIAHRPGDRRRAPRSPSALENYRQYEYRTVLESYGRYISIRKENP